MRVVFRPSAGLRSRLVGWFGGQVEHYGRIRRQVLLLAALFVSQGVVYSVIDWHRDMVVPLLLLGILCAVVVLVMDRRRPRP